MSISVLDERIKSGVNLTVKNGITYFDVVFYCSNQDDLDYVLPTELYHEAWWATPYYDNPNVIPKVIDYKITRVIPGADFPCLVSLTAADKLSDRFPNVNTDRTDLSDIVYKQFSTTSFYWHPSLFGMRRATNNDVQSSTRPKKFYSDTLYANVGDWIYINYPEDSPTYRGSPQLHGTGFDDSLDIDTDTVRALVGSYEDLITYTVTYYVRTKKIYRYAYFKGCNGRFPSKYRPGFGDSNDSQLWLVRDNNVSLHIDDKGNYWAKITRKFIYITSGLKWGVDTWTWK